MNILFYNESKFVNDSLMPLPDVGFRFAKYLLAIGVFILPVLVYFDYQQQYFIPAFAKIVATIICIGGLVLSRNIKYEHVVRVGATVTILLMSIVGAIYKLDSISGLIWVPVLPAIFSFLAGMRQGALFSGIYLFVFSCSYFSYELVHQVAPVDIQLWIHSVLAYLVVFLISVFFKGEKQKDESILKYAAGLDYLTRIANRRGIVPRIEDEVERAKRYKHPLSVILVDIDHFKMVNDKFGHSIGDAVLVETAALLKAEIRGSDIVARWGGEEFVILAPETDLLACVELAEKLRKFIESFEFSNVGRLTASFGVTQFQFNESWEHFVERGDSLLYCAKNAGRNKVASSDLD